MNIIRINMLGRTIRVIPCDIDQYYYVTKITIFNSSISILPIELFNLNLVKLDLFNNAIKVLPREIKNLTNLTRLDISSNELSKLPKEIFELKKIKSYNSNLNNNKFLKNLFATTFQEQLDTLENSRFID